MIIGSRDPVRATQAAEEIGNGCQGMSNHDCAEASDVVLVAVPWQGHAALLSDLVDVLAGKTVIDCVNPLGFDKQGAFPSRYRRVRLPNRRPPCCLTPTSSRPSTMCRLCCCSTRTWQRSTRTCWSWAMCVTRPIACRHWPRSCPGCVAFMRKAAQCRPGGGAGTANLISTIVATRRTRAAHHRRLSRQAGFSCTGGRRQGRYRPRPRPPAVTASVR